MTSVLLLQSPGSDAPDLAADFESAGFAVCGTGDCAHLVRETLRAAPDVLVCWAPRAGAALLESVAKLLAEQSVPVLVFTQDPSVEMLNAALDAGVHAWVVQGYAPLRLRPLVHLARAREAHAQNVVQAMAAMREKLDERKWIDKAKGILMHSQQLTEDEAFNILRTTSMQGNQRVGQLSRQVVDAAKMADAINRAGQQRMLSQRLVKLYALAASQTETAAAALLMRESVQRGDANLAELDAALSAATFGDLILAAREAWAGLRRAVELKVDSCGLAELDQLAQAVVTQSDVLVTALESSGFGVQIGVINVSGRQRMLSQRVAKLALLGANGGKQASAALLEATGAFEQGLACLNAAPLSTPQIRELLGRGAKAWVELSTAVDKVALPAGRVKLAAASEELLEVFDKLTQAYQHSVEVLLGA